MNQYKRIGDMLLDMGLLTPEQLEQAAEAQRRTNLRFGEVITALGFASEERIARCLAEQYGYELADLHTLTPDPAALQVVTPLYALSHLVLPIRLESDQLLCVLADPLDLPMTDALGASLRRRIEIQVAPPSKLYEAIVKHYDLPVDEDAPVPRPARRIAHLALAETAPPPEKPKRKSRLDVQEDRDELLQALGEIAEKRGPKPWLRSGQ